jgi:predicted RNA-binding protein (virulence factor B family)
MAGKLQAGQYYSLPVERIVAPGAYLRYGQEEVLLPNRWLPKGLQKGDELEVFIYHDGENRLIATTQKPYAVVGQFAFLKVVSTSLAGAFVDWGLTKDLLVPRSQQRAPMREGRSYLLYLYRDEQTGRVAATEWFDKVLKKTGEGLQVLQPVELIVYRKTPIGYSVIADHTYEALIHDADAVVPLRVGQRLQGFVKLVREDGKIDVVPGKPGYAKVTDEAQRILDLLKAHKGILPYSDKSDPADIYAFFGISKKVFKMAIGNLYKQRLIDILPGGIQLLAAD